MVYNASMDIREVAKKARVSVATISRSLSPETRVKVAPETLHRVDRIVKSCGYKPNLSARNLRVTKFNTIGVVLPHFRGLFFSDYYRKVLAGIADALLDSDYDFKMVMAKKDSKMESYDFRHAECVDALVVCHWQIFFTQPKFLKQLGIPCVVINDPLPDLKAHFAFQDNEMGGRLAARHLLEKGHRRIAVLRADRWSSDSRLRLKGFRREALKISKDVVIYAGQADFQEDKAFDKAEEMLSKNKDITAFFCLNDLMAMGVLRKLKALGIDCPREISVMGYDDDERARQSVPALTTIRAPLYDLTKTAVSSLVQFLDGKNPSFLKQTTQFPVCLVERRSVDQRQDRSRRK